MDPLDRLNDIHDYADAWSRKMAEIMVEKIERRKVVFTGKLHESISEQVQHTAAGATITLKFLEYGLAQEYGVGNGYTRGNGGDLKILDPDYRLSHGLNIPRRAGSKSQPNKTSGNPRKPRPWFNPKYYSSLRVMVEDLARIVEDAVAGVVVDSLSTDIHSAKL